ncbi:Cyclic di-GMP phosphodiesterase PdeB [Acaryochloris thomasi RCC1774]|uniref:Cyclic di-GMP phosphodiesterase PdeB n=2 Tax=Acaryochloris TaxID=155977 RepID=A0A2W1JML8_9CYAN|nr:Cyclic di-GMP phosphodiesterase PdeB [Acaryochloris thomasi RCC1774]
MALRIRRSLNPSEILQATVLEVRQLLEAERVIIHRFESDWSGVVITESVTDYLAPILGHKIEDHCFAEDWAGEYLNGRVQATADIYAGELSPCHVALLESLNIRANLVVPIIQEAQDTLSVNGWRSQSSGVGTPTRRLWGLLSVQQSSAPRQWQSAEIDIVEKLAVQVAIALQQAELYTTAQAELIKRQRAEAKMQQLNTQLEQLNAQLEQRVRHRTTQLEIANQELKHEIEERQQLEKELFQEKELAQITLESIGDAVVTTDDLGRVQYLNPVAERLLGQSIEAVEGKAFTDIFQIVHQVTREPVVNPVEQVLRENQVVYLAEHTLLIARDGTEYGIDDSAAPIRNRQGQLVGAVVVFHDVTEARQMAQELSWQASHDPLTGLVNRRAFEKQAAAAIAAVEKEQHHALCYLDLDQFKVVNDTCGHVAGDQLLRQITTVMQQRIRSSDTLARLGGDEFGLLLEGCSLEQAETLAEALRAMIQAFQFAWEDKTFSVGVSIGVVGIDSNSRDLASVLSAADAACYVAKSNGRNCVHVCRTHDLKLELQRGERQWVARLHQALEESRFCLYRQEILALDEYAHSGHCEILLRLFDTQGNVILPMAFLPAAERYNLMPAIDRWVVQHFCAQYHQVARVDQALGGKVLYNINLSGASINQGDFLGFLKTQLEQYQVPPQQICFEITETTAISNLHQAANFIATLKQLGCQFALDDFGSGMSSLAYLKNLPVDYLKIDGSFVKQLVNNKADSAIVECFNHLSHELGIQTIAECVEDEQTLEKLRMMGVDFAQGYCIDKPQRL